MPAPAGDPDAALRALIFDSAYDQYRGVVSSIRVMDGVLRSATKVRYMQAGFSEEVEEIGVRMPVPTAVDELGPGEVGYLIAGIKDVGQARSGETVTDAVHPAPEPLAGYRDPKPMVFCGLYPIDGDELTALREALEKLRLNDSSFTFEPESSGALGFGFRCGFLGLLAHGDRPRAPGARVRPVADRHGAVGGVRGAPDRRRRHADSRIRARCPTPVGSTTSTSPCSGRRSSCRRSTSGPSWSCVSHGAAISITWSTSLPSASSSSTGSRWPRWWSTSSTS